MQRVAERVSRAIQLPTTAGDVRRVLSAALASNDFWHIVSLADRPFNQVAETLKQLEAEGWVAFSDGEVHLTQAGRERCRAENVQPRQLHRFSACEGRSISLAAFADVLRRFETLAADRPKPILDYDQAYVTPETTISRVAIMADRGDLVGKRLLVLGDDDLVGLAAALTGLPQRVVVIEVDERLTTFMAELSRREGLGLEVVRHDLRDPLPGDLVGQCDTFCTDPPEAIQGLELFIARGLSSLAGPGCAGYFGMTLVESSLWKWRELQRLLVQKYRVVITNIIDDFSHYMNWGYLLQTVRADLGPAQVPPARVWYTSSLYRVEALADFERPSSTVEVDERLYLDSESLVWTRRNSHAAGA